MVRGLQGCSRKLAERPQSRRPRKPSCDSMMCSSSCARCNPTRPLLRSLVWSLSIRRSAASTRSRARSKSATVYCRGCCRVRFPRGPFDALFAKMDDLGCFMTERIASMQHTRLTLSLNARKTLRTIGQCAGDLPNNGHHRPPSRQTTACGTRGHAARPTIHNAPINLWCDRNGERAYGAAAKRHSRR
jgi:hypothetical protein